MKSINSLFWRFDVIAVTLCFLVFLIWPALDLHAARVFFDSESQVFFSKDYLIVKVFYEIFAYIQFPMLLGLFGVVGYALFKKNKTLRSKTLFLICCLVLGPGLLVNLVLKDNSVGRARPKQVVEFGGEHQFTSPFEYSGACQRNCSFSSGHASIGFVFLSLLWVAGRRRYFVGGVVLGGLLGLMRMAQGGHFLSDVIFSFWVVYFSSLFLARVFDLCLHKPEGVQPEEHFIPEPADPEAA